MKVTVIGTGNMGSAFVTHGQYDDKLPVSFAEPADSWLSRLGVPHDTRLHPVGHTLSADIAGHFSCSIHQQITHDQPNRSSS